MLDDRASRDDGPGHRATSTTCCRGRYRSRTGHGPRHRRRAAADGRLRRSSRRRAARPSRLKKLLPRARRLLDAGASWRARRRARGRAAGRAARRGAAAEPGAAARRSTSCSARQEELERVNRELEDTNRGVVALYAELDERADHLRRADELKTRFLSNMTPRVPDAGELDPGAARACSPSGWTRAADREGRAVLHPQVGAAAVRARRRPARPRQGRGRQDRGPARRRSRSSALFGALRGMLRPLLLNQSLALVFEEPDGMPPLVLRREQGLADPAQLHLERAEVHRARRGARRGAARAGGATRWSSRSPTPGIGIPRAGSRRGSSTSSCRSRTRCSAA